MYFFGILLILEIVIKILCYFKKPNFLIFEKVIRLKLSFFFFWYFENNASAFGFFSQTLSSEYFAIHLVAFFFGFLIFWFFRKKSKFGVELCLAGCFANYADRLTLKAVVDYLEIQFFEFTMCFNLADVYLQIGVCLLIRKLLKD